MNIYLQGLTMGLAYVAPIGLQNLFVINSALTQKRSRVYITALIVIFWDISLGVACFLGAGALMQALPWLQKVILGLGSLIVIYIGIGLLRSKASLEGGRDVNVPIWKLAGSAFVVTWLNPQAIIDGTMMLGAFRATLTNGGDLSALEAVNQVRARDGVDMPPLTSLDETKLRNERRIELAFEGHRFWDVRRWKIAETTENQPLMGMRIIKIGDRFDYNVVKVEDRTFRPAMYRYPIPFAEKMRYPSWEQNEGW